MTGTAYGADRLFDLAEAALRLAGVDGVEVVLSRTATTLTRFAESRIHQNVARTDAEARVRVLVGDAGGARVGVGVTNELTPEGLAAAAGHARDAALVSPPDPTCGGIAAPAGDYPSVDAYDGGTAAATPALRADLVARMLAELPRGVFGAGAAAADAGELAVATSLGVRGYTRATRATLRLLASGADSTGYAEDSAVRVGDLAPEELGGRAAGKVALGARPRELAPGTYPVVLEPAATIGLVEWLGWAAFGGKAVHEGRSPLAGRLGELVCSPLLTIVDDATSPLLPGMPFDFEGTAKRRTPLVEDGVAVGVTYDRSGARLAGAVGSTGHALPAPNAEGGLPLHLLVSPGQTAAEDLVAGLDRGLLVTRFHYTNLVHPTTATVTGMTRDGTFWVEDGRIRHGVRNLRFTQPILAALSGVQAVGRDTRLATDALFAGGVRAPGLRLAAFDFTSATTH